MSSMADKSSTDSRESTGSLVETQPIMYFHSASLPGDEVLIFLMTSLLILITFPFPLYQTLRGKLISWKKHIL